MSPSRVSAAMNSASRGGSPTKTWPSGTSTAETSSRSPFSSNLRRSSCSGTYGRDLMKRRNRAAVGPSAEGAAAPVSSATDDQQVARHLVERIAAFGSAHDDVLDARAVPTLDVDAGLDAERVALFERLVVARDHVRILVALEADPVPGAMDEQLAHARICDHAARCGVDLLALDAGPNGVARGLLRTLQNFVQPAELVTRPGVRIARDPHRARDVRAVTRDRAT